MISDECSSGRHRQCPLRPGQCTCSHHAQICCPMPRGMHHSLCPVGRRVTLQSAAQHPTQAVFE